MSSRTLLRDQSVSLGWFRRLTLAGLLLSPLSAFGCSDEPLLLDGRAAQQQPIFGGTPDDTRDAVMALQNLTGGVCTGTNIASEFGFGYLLTAAHCVGALDGQGQLILPFQPVAAEELLVLPGSDYLAPGPAFQVDEFAFPGTYAGEVGVNDIALVRYAYGDREDPPVIQALGADEDDFGIGDPFTLVGYGMTETDPDNSQRNQVDRLIQTLTEDAVEHSQDDGKGICSGDSGGPGLVSVGSGERVFAITSGNAFLEGQAPCETGVGIGMRVSFFQPFIDDFMSSADLCDDCWNHNQTSQSTCASEFDVCMDPEGACQAFLACQADCTSSSCVRACILEHQAGFAELRSFELCSCETCTACAEDTVCESFSCGAPDSGDWCTCLQEGCCDVTSACAQDPVCESCLVFDGFEFGCDENAAFQEVLDCAAGCAGDCDNSPVPLPEPETTTETSSTSSGGTGAAGGSAGTSGSGAAGGSSGSDAGGNSAGGSGSGGAGAGGGSTGGSGGSQDSGGSAGSAVGGSSIGGASGDDDDDTSGSVTDPDGSSGDNGANGGGSTVGCSCQVPGTSGAPRLPGFLALAVLLPVLMRRRSQRLL